MTENFKNRKTYLPKSGLDPKGVLALKKKLDPDYGTDETRKYFNKTVLTPQERKKGMKIHFFFAYDYPEDKEDFKKDLKAWLGLGMKVRHLYSYGFNCLLAYSGSGALTDRGLEKAFSQFWM